MASWSDKMATEYRPLHNQMLIKIAFALQDSEEAHSQQNALHQSTKHQSPHALTSLKYLILLIQQLHGSLWSFFRDNQ
jgi:hypothetical protein